jgi:hypothetical protein
MEARTHYHIVWIPQNKVVMDGLASEEIAKKALENYLVFHSVTDKRNEYKIEPTATKGEKNERQ